MSDIVFLDALWIRLYSSTPLLTKCPHVLTHTPALLKVTQCYT